VTIILSALRSLAGVAVVSCLYFAIAWGVAQLAMVAFEAVQP
jgi:hypothetical protein